MIVGRYQKLFKAHVRLVRTLGGDENTDSIFVLSNLSFLFIGTSKMADIAT
jgi:hypothetical protein